MSVMAGETKEYQKNIMIIFSDIKYYIVVVLALASHDLTLQLSWHLQTWISRMMILQKIAPL